MQLGNLIDSLRNRGEAPAIVFKDVPFTYSQIVQKHLEFVQILRSKGILAGQVIAIESDYSFESLALFLAILSNQNTACLVPRQLADRSSYLEDSEAEGLFIFAASGSFDYQSVRCTPKNPLLKKLRDQGHGGFIIFSSGSTGKPKAVLHDIERFLTKFGRAKKQFCTLSFLLFDHIAGLDTLLYALSSGGTLVFPEKRDVHTVCRLIQEHKVEVLPTSPTFLNLLCLSGEMDQYDLSSLKIITYGSEPMSPNTLNRLLEIFPNVKMVQKYGTSEFGSPISKSRDGVSLEIKFDPSNVNIKVVDNILWVKSESAMMGYLNAPNPMDEEGWYCTGDEVKVDGEWIRILGRKSDMIIVGGEKVYPSEVENVIITMENVIDVLVRGEPSPITGAIVCAKVHVTNLLDKKQTVKAIRKHCRKHLQPYKIPVKITPTTEPFGGSRHKKVWRDV